MKNNKRITRVLIGVCIFCLGLTGCNQSTNVPSYLKGYEDNYKENPRTAALKWFRAAEFGMFIHYGLFSLTEGYWGDIHSKPAEWVQLRAKIRPDEYAKLADKFTAENFDADLITDLAINAGMKYINITTRHHDGFCLFDSEYTDFKSTNSAAKRDLVAELAEQCHKKAWDYSFIIRTDAIGDIRILQIEMNGEEILNPSMIHQ
ncbi:alpha-L-fucosidase [Saccharicrinis sp. GN24d3]|uniref:alpha-L-fucosidase n=1 Tax=Saccharicrinis sp. GN24d3 TaxID=3458416 RepID=UPI0040352657